MFVPKSVQDNKRQLIPKDEPVAEAVGSLVSGRLKDRKAVRS